MFFRFCSALALVVLIATAGITIEKQLLDLRRKQTLQVYRQEQLEEKYARLKLRSQELGAPSRLLESLGRAEAERAARTRPVFSGRRTSVVAPMKARP